MNSVTYTVNICSGLIKQNYNRFIFDWFQSIKREEAIYSLLIDSMHKHISKDNIRALNYSDMARMLEELC